MEGWAEELLIPVLADNQGKNLTRSEVSIVNVGSTAYLHYARILMRNDGKTIDYPVSIVTDFDVKPDDKFIFNQDEEKERLTNIKNSLSCGTSPNIELYLATHWTLEWCLFHSDALGNIFMKSCEKIHSKTAEFKSDENGNFNWKSFREKLAEKLKNRSLDKVAIASEMCLAIRNLSDKLEFDLEDTAYYLIDAINHVCR